MDHQIPDQIKHARSNTLLELNAKNSEQYLQRHMGKEVEVLMEEQMILDGTAYFVGHTKEYIKVAVRTEENLTNQFVTVTAKSILKDLILLGER